jgi:hypothetical protein
MPQIQNARVPLATKTSGTRAKSARPDSGDEIFIYGSARTLNRTGLIRQAGRRLAFGSWEQAAD